MRRKCFAMALLGVLVLTISAIPVSAVDFSVPEGIVLGNLPLADDPNDVYYTTNPSDPWSGTPGDYRDDLDFKSITFSGVDLSIRFYGEPTAFALGVFIDVYISSDTNDTTYEYLISCTSSVIALIDSVNNLYWDGNSWVGSQSNCTYVDFEDAIGIINITKPLPNFGSYKVAGKSSNMGPPYYADRIISSAGGGIPGFPILLVLFSLFTFLGLIYFTTKRQSPL